MSFKLAFCRAVKQLSKVVSECRAVGTEISIPEAFVKIRVMKTRATLLYEALKEPTRKMLASNLAELSERVDIVTKQSTIRHDQAASQMRAMDTKLDALFSALGVAPPPPPEASRSPSPPRQRSASVVGRSASVKSKAPGRGDEGWLGSLMA